jgi:demethylmenaquinone methyltransferase / 2-methoxy-6-polyprenyl-1,4-benzoquinol methylase
MDQHRQKVHNVFTRIARRYDAMNTILSLSLDKYWRRRTLQIAAPQPGERWLDVCCGTGKISMELRRMLGNMGEVTGLDFNASMLEVAKRSETQARLLQPIHWIEADAMELPFPAESFDGITIGFGLRNLPDIDRGIVEMKRVLRPGGRWICLELSHPVWPVFRQGHGLFVRYLVPRIGNLGLGEHTEYQWLPESLQRFPGAEELKMRIHRAGMIGAGYERLSGGIAAIHVGYRNN